jgi:hypothetical protein
MLAWPERKGPTVLGNFPSKNYETENLFRNNPKTPQQMRAFDGSFFHLAKLKTLNTPWEHLP